MASGNCALVVPQPSSCLKESSVRLSHTLVTLSLAAASAAAFATRTPPLVEFSGAIGADPLTAAGGVDALNTVRGVNPGGRAWVMRKFKATVGADGSVSARGAGLLLASGEGIATRATIASVVVTLFCGPADATARKFTSAPGALDLAGNFRISGVLSEDGINAAVLPPSCDNPKMLIRSVNATTGVAGGWFAAGIPGDGDD
jgi:hypothetical protein